MKPEGDGISMKGHMYILLCSNGSYYTGSTNNLELRIAQHFSGQGANHTKKYPPVKVLYVEEFERVEMAFRREKQIQGWCRKKKEALMNGNTAKLHTLAQCLNETHFRNQAQQAISAPMSHPNEVPERSQKEVPERSRRTTQPSDEESSI